MLIDITKNGKHLFPNDYRSSKFFIMRKGQQSLVYTIIEGTCPLHIYYTDSYPPLSLVNFKSLERYIYIRIGSLVFFSIRTL